MILVFIAHPKNQLLKFSTHLYGFLFNVVKSFSTFTFRKGWHLYVAWIEKSPPDGQGGLTVRVNLSLLTMRFQADGSSSLNLFPIRLWRS